MTAIITPKGAHQSLPESKQARYQLAGVKQQGKICYEGGADPQNYFAFLIPQKVYATQPKEALNFKVKTLEELKAERSSQKHDLSPVKDDVKKEEEEDKGSVAGAPKAKKISLIRRKQLLHKSYYYSYVISLISRKTSKSQTSIWWQGRTGGYISSCEKVISGH